MYTLWRQFHQHQQPQLFHADSSSPPPPDVPERRLSEAPRLRRCNSPTDPSVTMLVVGVVTLGGRGHIRGGRGHAGGRGKTVCGRVPCLPGGRRGHALRAWSCVVTLSRRGHIRGGRGHAGGQLRQFAGVFIAFQAVGVVTHYGRGHTWWA